MLQSTQLHRVQRTPCMLQSSLLHRVQCMLQSLVCASCPVHAAITWFNLAESLRECAQVLSACCSLLCLDGRRGRGHGGVRRARRISPQDPARRAAAHRRRQSSRHTFGQGGRCCPSGSHCRGRRRQSPFRTFGQGGRCCPSRWRVGVRACGCRGILSCSPRNCLRGLPVPAGAKPSWDLDLRLGHLGSQVAWGPFLWVGC